MQEEKANSHVFAGLETYLLVFCTTSEESLPCLI